MKLSAGIECNIPNGYGLAIKWILASHIWIESVLTHIISNDPRFNKNCLKKRGFKLKLEAVQKIYGDEENIWIWNSIEKLNQARNIIAHVNLNNHETLLVEVLNLLEDFIDIINVNEDLSRSLRVNLNNKLRTFVTYLTDYMLLHFSECKYPKQSVQLNGIRMSPFEESSKEYRLIELFGDKMESCFPVTNVIDPSTVVD